MTGVRTPTTRFSISSIESNRPIVETGILA